MGWGIEDVTLRVALLQQQGVPTFTLNTIQRQRNPHLKRAVQAAYQQNIVESFEHLAPFIVEEKESAKGIQAAVTAYCNNPEALLMTLTNQDRHALNQGIRQQLQTRGVLTGARVNASVLIPYPMTAAARMQLTSFTTGLVLRFNQALPEQSIQAGTYYRIAATHPERGVLTLQSTQHPQQTLQWFLPTTTTQAQAVELYQVQIRPVQVGDTLVLTRSHLVEEHLSGTRWQVIAASSQQLTVKDAAGCTKQIELSEPTHQHWDYGYVTTVFKAQGRTTQEAIVYAPSHHTQLVNQVNFLVMISRATDKLTLITDNRDALLQRIQCNTGQKTSSLVATKSGDEIGFDSSAKMPHTATASTHKNNTTHKTALSTKTHTPQRIKTNKQELTVVRETIKARLHAQLPQSLVALLGEPKAKTPTHYRYGSKQGSLHVQITGDKQGAWYDFQTGEGGWDLISLIQSQQGCDFKQALAHAANQVGLTDHALKALLRNRNPNAQRTQSSSTPQQQSTLSVNKSAPPTQSKHPHTSALTSQQKKMRQLARTIVQKGQPAPGTLVARYLKTHRHITVPIPKGLLYHPNLYIKRYDKTFPAMLLPIKDDKGAIQQVHVTLLDKHTGNKAAVAQAKLKFGPTPDTLHAPLNNQRTKSNVTLVAEGLETALSLKTAFPEHNVQTVLDKSGFKRLNPEKLTPHVVLCLDNDLQNLQQDKVIQQALKKLTQAGNTVRTFIPPAHNHQKTDCNDVLSTQGKAALQQQLVPLLKQFACKERDHSSTPIKTYTPALPVKTTSVRER